jgi:hypothetical protein
MAIFRTYLVIVIVLLGLYTLMVGAEHGWNLIPIFFGNILAMDWQGQFNMDFMSFLALSATWVSWRHRFSPGGLLLGVVAFFGGMMFLAPYLIWASLKAKGDANALLLGERRAS